jgi:hypothetical protein
MLLERRLEVQASTFREVARRNLLLRVGQTLEIATFRALQQTGETLFGRFRDLNEHGDDQLYSKEEPPQHLGSHELEGDRRLDFLLQSPSRIWLGIECKNIREWLYPDRRVHIKYQSHLAGKRSNPNSRHKKCCYLLVI